MEMPNLDTLADIGLRGGVDMRPTLIRVLTDLYVQKLRHTPEEERHYTELALRLLDGVDVPTRAAIAARLSRHLSPPPRVVQYLVNDLPEIAAALRSHAVLQPPLAAAQAGPLPAATPIVEDLLPLEPGPSEGRGPEASAEIDSATAGVLNEQFFAATEYERRLILLNLHVVAPVPAGRIIVARDPGVSQRLEAAALGHYREDLAKQLAYALRIPRTQARRIAGDELGEPITVAVKALGVQRDVVYRILMFANPAVGHSVERVHALAALYDEMTLPAAEGMVAIWQALHPDSRTEASHRPLHWDDERAPARPATAARRPQTAPQTHERRDAS
jgi:uncharacterized protein (DUF2336 family)